MREKPWCVINLLDDTAETKWYETESAAIIDNFNEPVDIQYRPGRKAKVKK
jgi:hypothetical protein